MMPEHNWPAFVAVDVSDARGPARFLIARPGHSGFECIGGGRMSPLPTLAAVDEYLEATRYARPPSLGERVAALYGAMFGWDHQLAQPARHEPSPRD